MTLWEILKANKTGIAPDMFTMLAASKMNGGRDRLHELSGTPPLSFTAKGKPLTAWSITGNTVQTGTPTPENPVEVQAVGDRTGNLFDYKKYFESTFTEYNEFFEFAEIQLKPFTTYTFNTSFREYVGATTVIETAFIIATSTEEPRTVKGGISSTRIATKTTESDGIIKIYKRIKGSNLPKKEDFDSGMHWLMINEGDTALPYEPYGYKIPVVTSADGTEPITTTIYLGEVQTTRKIKKAVLNGTETTWTSATIQGRMSFYWKTGTQNPTGAYVLCTHYKSEYAVREGVCFITTNNVAIIDSNFQSLDDFKTYLADEYAAGHPVTVWYVQNIPTTGIVNEPLMKIGDRADTLSMEQAGVQIPTLNGTTVIDVDTAVKPESMTIKYRR